MRYWSLLAILGLAFLAQTTFAGFLAIGGVAPNLLQAVVVTFGLLFGPEVGAASGALAGILRDVAFGKYIGLSVISLGLVGWLAGLAERRVFKDNLFLPILAGFLATLIAESINLAVVYFFEPALVAGVSPQETILPSGLYTTVATFLIYSRILRSYRYLRPDPRGAIRFLRRR